MQNKAALQSLLELWNGFVWFGLAFGGTRVGFSQ